MTPAALAPDVEPEKVLDKARRLGVPVLRMQSMEGATPGVLAPVDIEDLLLRPSHDVDGDLVGRFVRGKRCVVTGGGGSIGGEICRRLKAYDAAAILVLENSELALHSIQEDLARTDGAPRSRGISSTSARRNGSPRWSRRSGPISSSMPPL